MFEESTSNHKANGPNVCQKIAYIVPPRRQTGQCMQKIAYNVPPRRQTGQMYAKNRIQCAAAKANGTNVCEKSHTMCRREGKRAKCMRKIAYNVPPRRQTGQCMRKIAYIVSREGKRGLPACPLGAAFFREVSLRAKGARFVGDYAVPIKNWHRLYGNPWDWSP